jgi:hypothetical protein
MLGVGGSSYISKRSSWCVPSRSARLSGSQIHGHTPRKGISNDRSVDMTSELLSFLGIEKASAPDLFGLEKGGDT